MNMVEGELEIPQPFSLRLTLYMGQAFRWRRLDGSVDKLEDGGRYPDNEWHSGVLGEFLIHLRQAGSRVEYRASKLGGPADDEDVRTLLQGYFRLDDDVSRIYSDLTNRDASIARLIENHGGMRLLRQDPWECTVAYLCSANNNIPRISSIVERISAAFGDTIEMCGKARHTFPAPELLITETAAASLQGMQFGLQRDRKIAGAAREVCNGDLNLYALRSESYPHAKRAVKRLEGIGDKIADCISLFSLDKTEAFPIDRHIRSFVTQNYPAAPKNDAAIRLWAQGTFGQYAGYAGQFMFCDQPK